MTPRASATPPAATPEARLAATFGRHIAHWSRQQGASAAAASLAQRSATRLSTATSDGHSCLALVELLDSLNGNDTEDTAPPLDLAALRRQLLASRVVGTPDVPDSLPLILDDERLYLHRYFDYECRLARSLSERGADVTALSDLPPQVITLLDTLFAANSPEPGATDWQKIAAITALLGRLTIISGGPGTGKTTTVVNLLACLLEADPACRVALAAPTGKAAARMTEVILQRAGHLPAALRARLPTEASTIHRLLGSRPDGGFRHDAADPLPIDVLVVDEASMLDLALAVHLLEAVPTHARIILLGDKDQLAAVESGAVFSELSAQPAFSASRLDALLRLAGAAPATSTSTSTSTAQLDLPFELAPPSGLEDSVVWLRRNYRFAANSAIGLLATDTNNGHTAAALQRLAHPPDDSLRWLDDAGSVPSADSVEALFDGYAAYTAAVRAHAGGDAEPGEDATAVDPVAVSAAFAGFRVLCAVRDGPWGVNALNQQISSRFRRTLQHPLDPSIRSAWYPGRPVMVLRNDPVLKLFNGDVGIVLPDATGTLQVYFPADDGGFRAIAPVRLPDHETAFAMTVHKSQGSEFDAVLLILPAENNRILTRELIYTAVTRARARLSIVANARVIAAAIDTPTQRVSGLLARLRGHRLQLP